MNLSLSREPAAYAGLVLALAGVLGLNAVTENASVVSQVATFVVPLVVNLVVRQSVTPVADTTHTTSV